MSDEQHVIFDHIRTGDNVLVDACAGSGKSTTILSIAKFLPDMEICMVTYNAMLCKEIRKKAEELSLCNLRVHTYHSINVQHYVRDGHTDTAMRRILQQNAPPVSSIPHIHLLVVDEAQDMTELYYRFLVKFSRDHQSQHTDSVIQVLVLGDQMQGLYEFKGSDTRFLSRADEIWRDFEFMKTKVWHKCTLRMSYRITDQMGAFVNNIMIGENRMLTCRNGVPVVYLRKRVKEHAVWYIRAEIQALIRSGASSAGEFFILSGSVKTSNTMVQMLENSLVEMGIPCFVPSRDDDKVDDDRIIDGKVVFSTFHTVKGRQRKYVFVLGFDNSYFEWIGRDLCPDECPNTLYVACTRATHRLYVVDVGARPLSFLRMTQPQIKAESYMKFEGIPQSVFPECSRAERLEITHHISPTELIRFIPPHVMDEIVPLLDTMFICETKGTSESQEELEIIDIPTMIETSAGQYEDISDLNGITIPAVYFEHLFSPNIEHPPSYTNSSLASISDAGSGFRNNIIANLETMNTETYRFLHLIASTLPDSCTSISDYLYLTNIHKAVRERLYFKVKQIVHYDWLTEPVLQKFFDRMNLVFSEECFDRVSGELNAETEVAFIKHEFQQERINAVLAEHIPPNDSGKIEMFRFTPIVDVITSSCVWEIKCTTDLTTDHFIQVVIYAWLWRITMEDIMNLENVRDFRLYNIKTGQIWRLLAGTEDLTKVVVLLLKSKYRGKKVCSDVDFISSIKT